MAEQDLVAVLEDALHALISARCARAYKHELRNGLQGVYGGVDALIRCARPNTTSGVPLEKTIGFVREAIARHESSLDRMVEHLAPGDDAAQAVNVAAQLAELANFLRSDAARHSIRFRETLGDSVSVVASRGRLRLMFLGLMTDSIDAMPDGGEIRLAVRALAGRAQIEMVDTRTPSDLDASDPWKIDLAAKPLRRGILLPVTRAIVHAQNGTIDCESGAGGGRSVRIYLPLAAA